MRRILVATDLSRSADRALERATALARALGASIDLVHVRDVLIHPWRAGLVGPARRRRVVIESIDRSLAERSQRVVDAGVICVTTSLSGRPLGRITAHARKVGADLIVVGARRSPLAEALLGSVAETLLLRARCPVLVVPAATEA